MEEPPEMERSGSTPPTASRIRFGSRLAEQRSAGGDAERAGCRRSRGWTAAVAVTEPAAGFVIRGFEALGFPLETGGVRPPVPSFSRSAGPGPLPIMLPRTARYLDDEEGDGAGEREGDGAGDRDGARQLLVWPLSALSRCCFSTGPAITAPRCNEEGAGRTLRGFGPPISLTGAAALALTLRIGETPRLNGDAVRTKLLLPGGIAAAWPWGYDGE